MPDSTDRLDRRVLVRVCTAREYEDLINVTFDTHVIISQEVRELGGGIVWAVTLLARAELEKAQRENVRRQMLMGGMPGGRPGLA